MSDNLDKWQDNQEAHEALHMGLIALSERLERVETALSTVMGIMDAKWDIMWYNEEDPQQRSIYGKNEEVTFWWQYDWIHSQKDSTGRWTAYQVCSDES